jgi:hypothetical protein
MIYDDGAGRRIHRGLRGRQRPQQGIAEPSEAVRDAIRRVVEDHPRWGPRQAYAELRLTRHDIPVATIERVMNDLRRTRPIRGRGRL